MIVPDEIIDRMLPRLDYAAGGGGAVSAGEPAPSIKDVGHVPVFTPSAPGEKLWSGHIPKTGQAGVASLEHLMMSRAHQYVHPPHDAGLVVHAPFHSIADRSADVAAHHHALTQAGYQSRLWHEWNGVEGFAPRPFTHLLSWVDPATGQTQAEHFPTHGAAQTRRHALETGQGSPATRQFFQQNPMGARVYANTPAGRVPVSASGIPLPGYTGPLHPLAPEQETPPAPLLPHEHLREHMRAAGDQADPNQFLQDLGIPRQLHDALLEKWTAGGHLGETPQADWRPNEMTGEDYYTYARPTFPLIYADETIDAMLAGTNGHAPAPVPYAAEVKPPARPLILEEPAAPEPDHGTAQAIDRLASMLGKWAPRLLPADRRDGRKRRFTYDDGTGCTVTEKVGEDGGRSFRVKYDDGTEATATEEDTDAGRVIRFKTAKGATCTLEAAGAGGSRTLTFRHGDGTETTMTEG